MQNNTALMILVVSMSAILISNSGCGGANPAQSSFGSIAVPTTGVCGASVISGDETVIAVVSENACYSGTLEDIADSTTLYKWNCLGASGGKSVACSLEMPPASVLPGTSNGLMNDAGYFYVGVDTSKGTIAHVHGSTGFDTPCGISKDSLAMEDITCMIELPEGDIYGKSLQMKYNVPNGEMCRYLVTEPYWFYNYEVGFGPSSIVMSVDQTVNASGDITGANYTCNFDGGPPVACASNPELSLALTPTDQTISCAYDYSKADGPNCCLGEKLFTKYVNKSGVTTTTTETGKWGGSWGGCIGGHGKTNWGTSTANGIPSPVINFVEDGGYNDKMTVTSPSSISPPISLLKSSIHVANYYGDFADHTHTGFVDTVTTSTAPYFMEPIDDRSGDVIPPAHIPFELQCLDGAFEVRHRIRVYIRDWDTMPDYLAYVASAGTVMVPDRGNTGEPAANCVGLGTPLFAGCNDSWDADDFLTIYLGIPNYVMAPISNRRLYFPFIKY